MDPHLHSRCCRPVDLAPVPSSQGPVDTLTVPLALVLAESLGKEALLSQRSALRESQKLNKKLSTHLDQTLLLLRDLVVCPSPRGEDQRSPHEAKEGQPEVNFRPFPPPERYRSRSRQSHRGWRSRTPDHRNTNWRQSSSSQTKTTGHQGTTVWVDPTTTASSTQQQQPIGSERKQKKEDNGNASMSNTQN